MQHASIRASTPKQFQKAVKSADWLFTARDLALLCRSAPVRDVDMDDEALSTYCLRQWQSDGPWHKL
ncbi:hypothetical protein [Sporisorium scitamineum]|uniref:Uncharacterized protein n=1 Tax=Sporisorium scitamineum TaxID=49012 RepID=A0A0F7SA06_9BASI|nr:hypothetical protein [Sporisorium scitamineum]